MYPGGDALTKTSPLQFSYLIAFIHFPYALPTRLFSSSCCISYSAGKQALFRAMTFQSEAKQNEPDSIAHRTPSAAVKSLPALDFGVQVK